MTTNKGGVNMRYVYRMMSQHEYMDLIAGKTLVNTTVHDTTHRFSYSTGFCFLPWEVKCNTWRNKLVSKMTAMQAIDRILPGASKYDVWVQLKVVNPKVLTKSCGRYCDSDTDTIVWTTEFCTTSYSIKDLYPMHAFSMRKVQDTLFARWLGSK